MTTAANPKRSARNLKPWIITAVVVIVLAIFAFGTKVVSNSDPSAAGTVAFDPKTYGAQNFPKIKEAIAEQAVDAPELATALQADADAAAKKYGKDASGNFVYSVKLTGVVGEGESGIYDVKAEGVPEGITVRVQMGPAINGTDLRDATGKITFGQFTNQIDFQNAGASLNDEMKKEVLAKVDTKSVTGKTITLTGVFTSINPKMWLITPSEMSVQ